MTLEDKKDLIDAINILLSAHRKASGGSLIHTALIETILVGEMLRRIGWHLEIPDFPSTQDRMHEMRMALTEAHVAQMKSQKRPKKAAKPKKRS